MTAQNGWTNPVSTNSQMTFIKKFHSQVQLSTKSCSSLSVKVDCEIRRSMAFGKLDEVKTDCVRRIQSCFNHIYESRYSELWIGQLRRSRVCEFRYFHCESINIYRDNKQYFILGKKIAKTNVLMKTSLIMHERVQPMS